MEIITKVKEIISSPVSFFTNLKEESVSAPFGFFALLAIPYTILLALFGQWFLKFQIMMNPALATLPPNFYLIMAPIGYILGLGLIWVFAGIFHILLMIVGNKESYGKTMQIYSYATAPMFLFGWIPFIGGLAGIWTIVLYFIGTMNYLKLSGMRSTVAIIIIPGIIFAILFAIMMVAVIAIIASVASSAATMPY